jgi:hypothetical protein
MALATLQATSLTGRSTLKLVAQYLASTQTTRNKGSMLARDLLAQLTWPGVPPGYSPATIGALRLMLQGAFCLLLLGQANKARQHNLVFFDTKSSHIAPKSS